MIGITFNIKNVIGKFIDSYGTEIVTFSFVYIFYVMIYFVACGFVICLTILYVFLFVYVSA